jgi:hypothetical protein
MRFPTFRQGRTDTFQARVKRARDDAYSRGALEGQLFRLPDRVFARDRAGLIGRPMTARNPNPYQRVCQGDRPFKFWWWSVRFGSRTGWKRDGPGRIFREWKQSSNAIAALSTNAPKQSS